MLIATGQFIKAEKALAFGLVDAVIEPRVGGRWYERDADGTEHNYLFALEGIAAGQTATLTAADGASITLQPDIIIDEGVLAVTIPGGIAPGNYSIRALKADFQSNPAVVSIIPPITITRATWSLDKRVTITGSGFGGYAAGSGTAVTGEVSNGLRTKSVTGEVVAWAPGKIVVKFPLIPSAVTVKSVFGGATSAVGKR